MKKSRKVPSRPNPFKAKSKTDDKDSKKKKSRRNSMDSEDEFDDDGLPMRPPQIIALIVLISVNFVVGLILLVYGIYILVDKSGILYILKELVGGLDNSFIINLTFANPIVWGIFSVIPLAIMIHAVTIDDGKQAWTSMTALFAILIVLILFQLSFILVPIIMLSISTPSQVQSLLQSSLSLEYVGLPAGWYGSRTKSLLWDELMVDQHCCGVNGNMDFMTASYFQATAWLIAAKSYTLSNGTNYINTDILLPISCCILKSYLVQQSGDWWNMPNYVLYEMCPLDPTPENSYFSTGCLSAVTASLTEFTNNSFAGLIVMVILMLASCILIGLTLYAPHLFGMDDFNDPDDSDDEGDDDKKRKKKKRRNNCCPCCPRKRSKPNQTQPMREYIPEMGQAILFSTSYYKPSEGQDKIQPYPPTNEIDKPVPRTNLPSTYSNQMNDVYYTKADPKRGGSRY